MSVGLLFTVCYNDLLHRCWIKTQIPEDGRGNNQSPWTPTDILPCFVPRPAITSCPEIESWATSEELQGFVVKRAKQGQAHEFGPRNRYLKSFITFYATDAVAVRCRASVCPAAEASMSQTSTTPPRQPESGRRQHIVPSDSVNEGFLS